MVGHFCEKNGPGIDYFSKVLEMHGKKNDAGQHIAMKLELGKHF